MQVAARLVYHQLRWAKLSQGCSRFDVSRPAGATKAGHWGAARMDSDYPVPVSGFSDNLVGCNGLDVHGFEAWVFYPGMLFGAWGRWWGGREGRDRPHEGLDFCLYRGRGGVNNGLDEKTLIPVMYDGEVARIEDDFLAKSVYVSHGIVDGKGSRLHTVYGHVQPEGGVREGQTLMEGEIFASVAPPRRGKQIVAPHLHVSVVWVPSSLSREDLGWRTIADSDMAILVNPLEAIRCDYMVLRQECIGADQ